MSDADEPQGLQGGRLDVLGLVGQEVEDGVEHAHPGLTPPLQTRKQGCV